MAEVVEKKTEEAKPEEEYEYVEEEIEYEEEVEDKKVRFDLDKNTVHQVPSPSTAPIMTRTPSTTNGSSSTASKPVLKLASTSTSSSTTVAASTTLWPPTNINVKLLPKDGEEVIKVEGDDLANTKATKKDATAAYVPITFIVHYTTVFGQIVHVCGSTPELGCWDVEKAPKLNWNLGHYWKIDLFLQSSTIVEYKYFVRNADGDITWENGSNHLLSVPTKELLHKEHERTCDKKFKHHTPHTMTVLNAWSFPSAHVIIDQGDFQKIKELSEEEKEKLRVEERNARKNRGLSFAFEEKNKDRAQELQDYLNDSFSKRKSIQNNANYSSCGFSNTDPILVIDAGTEVLRAGFAGEAAPKIVAQTAVGSKRNSLTETFLVIDPSTSHGSNINRKIYSYRQPMAKGIIENWDDMQLIWQHYIYEEQGLLREKTKVPVILSESVFNPKFNREKTLSIMFETLETPALSLINQEVLALYGSGRSRTGLVVSSGASTTQIVPIYEGCALRNFALQSNLGGKVVTDLLCKYFHINDLDWYQDYEKNEKLKQALELLSIEKSSELRKSGHNSPGARSITAQNTPLSEGFVGRDKYLLPEVLFNPEENGFPGKGIHEGIYYTVARCDKDIRNSLMRNVVLHGGNTKIKGFDSRLFEELNEVLPSQYPISIYADENRQNLAWLGGSVLGSQSYTPDLFISKSLYEECGASIIHRMCW